MKYYFLTIFFCTLSLFAQKKKEKVEIDSTTYYIEIANFHKKNNNFGSSMDYIQKAIKAAEKNQDYLAQANAFSFLGNVYFELKKVNDAILIFNKSIPLYAKQKPTANQAYTLYNLGLCYSEKKEYSTAENYFNEAEKIYELINVPEGKELINLQKGILHQIKGDDDKALTIFSTLISKQYDEDKSKIN